MSTGPNTNANSSSPRLPPVRKATPSKNLPAKLPAESSAPEPVQKKTLDVLKRAQASKLYDTIKSVLDDEVSEPPRRAEKAGGGDDQPEAPPKTTATRPELEDGPEDQVRSERASSAEKSQVKAEASRTEEKDSKSKGGEDGPDLPESADDTEQVVTGARDRAQQSSERHADAKAATQAFHEANADEAEENHLEDVEDEAAERAAEELADDLMDDEFKMTLDKDGEQQKRRRRQQLEEEEEEGKKVEEVSETRAVSKPVDKVGYTDKALAALAQPQLPALMDPEQATPTVQSLVGEVESSQLAPVEGLTNQATLSLGGAPAAAVLTPASEGTSSLLTPVGSGASESSQGQAAEGSGIGLALEGQAGGSTATEAQSGAAEQALQPALGSPQTGGEEQAGSEIGLGVEDKQSLDPGREAATLDPETKLGVEKPGDEDSQISLPVEENTDDKKTGEESEFGLPVEKENPTEEEKAREQEQEQAQQEERAREQEQVREPDPGEQSRQEAREERREETQERYREASEVVQEKEEKAAEAQREAYEKSIEADRAKAQAETEKWQADLEASRAKDELEKAQDLAEHLKERASEAADPEEAEMLMAQAEQALADAKILQVDAAKAKAEAKVALTQASALQAETDAQMAETEATLASLEEAKGVAATLGEALSAESDTSKPLNLDALDDEVKVETSLSAEGLDLSGTGGLNPNGASVAGSHELGGGGLKPVGPHVDDASVHPEVELGGEVQAEQQQLGDLAAEAETTVAGELGEVAAQSVEQLVQAAGGDGGSAKEEALGGVARAASEEARSTSGNERRQSEAVGGPSAVEQRRDVFQKAEKAEAVAEALDGEVANAEREAEEAEKAAERARGQAFAAELNTITAAGALARKREADDLEKAAESKKDESKARAEQSEALKETVEIVRENEVKLEVAEKDSEQPPSRTDKAKDTERADSQEPRTGESKEERADISLPGEEERATRPEDEQKPPEEAREQEKTREEEIAEREEQLKKDEEKRQQEAQQKEQERLQREAEQKQFQEQQQKKLEESLGDSGGQDPSEDYQDMHFEAEQVLEGKEQQVADAQLEVYEKTIEAERAQNVAETEKWQADLEASRARNELSKAQDLAEDLRQRAAETTDPRQASLLLAQADQALISARALQAEAAKARVEAKVALNEANALQVESSMQMAETEATLASLEEARSVAATVGKPLSDEAEASLAVDIQRLDEGLGLGTSPDVERVELSGPEPPKVEDPVRSGPVEPAAGEPGLGLPVEPPKSEPVFELPVEEPVQAVPVEPPKVEVPVVEAPKLEEPIQAEPPLRVPDPEPVRSELPVESNFSLPVMQEPMKAEPVAELPPVEEPVVETPRVEDPVVEPPRVEVPVQTEPVVALPPVDVPEPPRMEEPVRSAPVAPPVSEPVFELPVVEPIQAAPVEPPKVEVPVVEIPKAEVPVQAEPPVNLPDPDPVRSELPKSNFGLPVTQEPMKAEPIVELPPVEVAEPPRVEEPVRSEPAEPPKSEPVFELPVEEPIQAVPVEPPKVEVPVVEAPKLEEPIQTEPPLRVPDPEPVRSELPVESNFSLPVMQEPMKAEPVAELPPVEEPVVETPRVEDPVVEPPRVEVPVQTEPVVALPPVEVPEQSAPVESSFGLPVEVPKLGEPVKAESPTIEAPIVEEPVSSEPPQTLPDPEPVRTELPKSSVSLPLLQEPMKAEPVAEPPRVEPVSSGLAGPFPDSDSVEHSFKTGPLPELPPFGLPQKSRSLPDPVAVEPGPILPVVETSSPPTPPLEATQVAKAQSLPGILPTKQPAATSSSDADEAPPRGELQSPLEPSSVKPVQQAMGYALSSSHDRVVEPQKSMAEQFSPPPGKLQKAARERTEQTANPGAAQSARAENREGSISEPLEVKLPKRAEIQAEPIRMETSSKVQQEVVRDFGQGGRPSKPGETPETSRTTFVATPSVTPTSSPKLEPTGKETDAPPAIFRNRSEAQSSETKPTQAEDIVYAGPLRRRDDPRSQADDGQTLFERKTVPEPKDDGSEIFLLNRRKTDPKPNVEESVLFRKRALENDQLPPPVTVWSKANNNALDSDNWGDLNKEQKIVKRALLDLTGSAMKIGSVKMTHDTSKVYAEVVDLDVKDWAQVGYLAQEFKEKTGRELIITDTSRKERRRPEPEPEPDPVVPRPRSVTPTFIPYQSAPEVEDEEEEKKKKESAIEHMTAKVDSAEKSRESRIYRRSRPATESSGLEIPPAPIKKQDSGPEKDDSDLSVKKLRGRAARPKTSGGGGGTPRSKGGGGGGSRTQGRAKFRRSAEEKELPKERSDGKEKELGGLYREKLDTETGLKISLVRMDLAEQAEDSRSEGGGGGSGTCSTCGTELPAAQAQNCPICAQAGQDIMALTKTNYRFAGTKLFATADTVVASAQAKNILQQEMLTSVASLRYWPKIPGHKEILRLRAQ